MIAKFSEAMGLLGRHLGLFTAIILTVWLPGNVLVNYVAYNMAEGSEVGIVRLSMWIEGIFGPIYIGALVYALFEIKSGRSVAYKEAMAVGFKKWGSLFAARFAAGLLMALGLVAFVIPGVMVAVRYALVDAAVIVEGKGASASLSRSVQLTAGRRWQIFGAAVSFFLPLMALSVGLYLPLAFVESLDIAPVAVVLDCVLDVVYAVIQIVMFLFYWEATADQRRSEQSDSPPDESGEPFQNLPISEGAALPGENDNPYRSPVS